ncbi:Na+/H+ antiporter NhaC family protein [uncultured Cetobacterium sp.]|uniref:Na+/H+ antiporter NhaC family protein n=1 Tax=uncultured Cetobacterium sp. TaxID=527638 RepID=UPI0026359813|nr:Na+/H+ antiporter NhaC family protein [uncultured Cetobacterium sp.]
MRINFILFCISIAYAFLIKSNILMILSIVFVVTLILSSFKLGGIKRSIEIAEIGAKKSYALVMIFSLLGMLSASWFLSGTIPSLIYYGIKIINPNYFYIFTFIILSVFSFLMGSSFGSVGTMGIVMISLARGIELNLFLTAGAVISGAYFGDRGSPTSSSANFVALLTDTNIYNNVKNMFKIGFFPYLIVALLYFCLGKTDVAQGIDSTLDRLLLEEFTLSPLVFIPLLILIAMCLFRVDIKRTMAVSILSSLAIAFLIQNYSLEEIVKTVLLGFRLPLANPLYKIIRGGGIVSMGTATVMAFLSCSIVKIFEELKILNWVSKRIGIIEMEWKAYLYTAVVAIFTSGISSSQSTSILLTSQIMKKTYEESGFENEELALDIENSCVILSPLIPWNIAITVPAAMLEMGVFQIIPNSFYLYILPLFVLVKKIFFTKRRDVEIKKAEY